MTILEKIEHIRQKFQEELSSASSLETLEGVRVNYLGRKSELVQILRSLKSLAEDERRSAGSAANVLKTDLESGIESQKEVLESKEVRPESDLDMTMPATDLRLGKEHPLTRVMAEIEGILMSMGFAIARIQKRGMCPGLDHKRDRPLCHQNF